MVLAAHVRLLRRNTAERFEDARGLIINLNMEMKFPFLHDSRTSCRAQRSSIVKWGPARFDTGSLPAYPHF